MKESQSSSAKSEPENFSFELLVPVVSVLMYQLLCTNKKRSIVEY